jgi:hypothetical protein
MSRAAEVGLALHALALAPFCPPDQNDVGGRCIAEPIEQLKNFDVDSVDKVRANFLVLPSTSGGVLRWDV